LPFSWLPVVSFPAAFITDWKAIITSIVMPNKIGYMKQRVDTKGSFDTQRSILKGVVNPAAFFIVETTDTVWPAIVVPLITGKLMRCLAA
jgi:hypothetical protein